ncbi:MAG TPA: hypothetical protein VHE35_01750 [Kofleriaceae bacterium]|nr:hypothetical protein [Kofleriaceae bacterium]
MSQLVHCNHCGAPMQPHADGRIFACEFCGSKEQVAIDAAQIAAGMKLDTGDIEGFVFGLARSLQLAMPDRTRVVHAERRIVLLELNLDPHLYLTRREPHGGFTAQYKKLVRGVALRTKTLALDVWVRDLTQAMAEHANQNAKLAQVLAQLRAE